MLSLTRQQFPLVLSYDITVHKSQGLTFPDGCVFNTQHEPTWFACKSQPGLAFVGMSRTTEFALMAFKYVPDYWVFRSVAETDLVKWREKLEKRLDDLHDATAARIFSGHNTVRDDMDHHVTWSEQRLGRKLTQAEVEDLQNMLSLRGMLTAPVYTDKPVRGLATKGGGGRNKRKVMRADARDQIEERPVEEQVYQSEEENVQEDDEEAYWRELQEEDERLRLLTEAYWRGEYD